MSATKFEPWEQELFQRISDEMGDAHDLAVMGKFLKERGKIKRGRNRANAAKILNASNIYYSERNDGAHLIIGKSDPKIDFWPGTGKWIVRNSKDQGRGVLNLLQYLARTKHNAC